MVTRSRFLKQGSMPPSSSDRYSYRASSIAPRNQRATSAAPLRASSVVPARASSIARYRSTSVAPVRASSVAPYRSSSVAPVRASYTAPYRCSSVAPMRASSVTPSYYESRTRASSVSPYVSAYDNDFRCLRASSFSPQSTTTFRSTPLVPRDSSSYRIDTSVPTRQFGTRLGVHKVETSVKPAIYDEYYGMTYVPSSGRDSWSAYRISDETLDDNDDLVYASAKKDHEVMKRVNKQIQQVEALSLARPPPPVYIPVAAAAYTYRRVVPQQISKVRPVSRDPRPKVNNSMLYRVTPRHNPAVSRNPVSDVKVSYRMTNEGSEILRPNSKSIVNEPVTLDQPAAFNTLKARLRDARANIDRNKVSLSKYSADPEMRAINAEVNAIRSARTMREESMKRLK